MKRKRGPPAPKKWSKVLYKKQQFQDNYTDSSFLSQLRRNVFLCQPTFKEAALVLCSVTLELCCSLLFVVTFIFLDRGSITSCSLAYYSAYLAGFGIFLLGFKDVQETLKRNEVPIFDLVVKGVVLLLLGYVFAPILKTLTQTVSSDTIYAMVATLLLFHVVLQDYFPHSKVTYSCVSLNTALCAAVCLASQLKTVEETFVFTIFAFQIFIFTPCFRVVAQDHDTILMFFTGFFTVFMGLLLFQLKPVYPVLFLSACIFVNLICPRLFVQYQIYKDNKYGPWDEAIIFVKE